MKGSNNLTYYSPIPTSTHTLSTKTLKSITLYLNLKDCTTDKIHTTLYKGGMSMDTGSHIIIGLGLAALAQLDPVVAENPVLSQAVLAGTILGSNAPDFDYLLKLKGKGFYKRHHRGWSHSIVILPFLALTLSSILYLSFTPSGFTHLFFWTLLATLLHVFFDLFNVYGTQALRPFTTKWISFDSIPLTDTYILLLHAAGFVSLLFYEAGTVFAVIYSLMFLYIGFRTFYSFLIKRTLSMYFQKAIEIKLIPQQPISKWIVLIETENDYLFGVYVRKEFTVDYVLPKQIDFPNVVVDSLESQTIRDFILSTKYAFPHVQKRKNGYFVLWKDLRFRRRTFFPIFAVIYIPFDSSRHLTYSGSCYSLKKYKKIVRQLKNHAQLEEKENLPSVKSEAN